MPAQPAPPAPIRHIETLDDVIDALDAVIQWSIGASSRLGYFAAMYKRITIAVRTAVDEGAFEDGPRMERFDVAFANRYFDALNGYFHPREFPKPTRSWQVTFDSAARPEPIILQHMLAGVNTHIDLDLGITAQQIVRDQLPSCTQRFQQDQRRAGQPGQRLGRRHQRNLTRVGRRVRRADAAPDLRDQPSGENFPGQRLAIRDASEHANPDSPDPSASGCVTAR